ncbi:hypothetical protein C922_05282 [Plasmodium inui San Antonio 1]|uniref:Tryptophan/threonine-rich plasmodium antigen C-terminal domain-containing protein n=1 Tax=Plasmodium inui San Antonio 1 TaxID=1237626 RepID=W6ZYC4_9APIC|nr:hypothetical protein C922_05282 [Plasmodium inui San Antonio 1]EUD64343.1 hypothetical protein C922_05282 [Plasmodium inui San Antonio 1]
MLWKTKQEDKKNEHEKVENEDEEVDEEEDDGEEVEDDDQEVEDDDEEVEDDDEEVENEEEEVENEEQEEADQQYYHRSHKEDYLTKQEEKNKGIEEHIAEGMEKIRKLLTGADKQKNHAVLTYLQEMPEEQLEKWKNKEWKKYMANIEEEWQLLNLWIEEQRQNWIDSKDKQLENWMNEMENKWMDIDNIDKEYGCRLIKSCLKGDDESQIKEKLKHELKNLIYRDWKSWIQENESQLNTWLIKLWIQWKNNKISKFLMAEWKLKENEYWNEWEKTETWKWLYFNKRRQWETWKKRVTNEKQEWENWVRIKEERVIYSKYKKLTLWMNKKKPSINQWVESLADKCVNDSRWNTWINEKYSKFMLEQKLEKRQRRREEKRKELMKKRKKKNNNNKNRDSNNSNSNISRNSSSSRNNNSNRRKMFLAYRKIQPKF